MGDAIFDILNYMCNLPKDQLVTQEDLIDNLNKEKKVDPPYYGIGNEEIQLLIKEDYLLHRTPNSNDLKLADYEKSIIATPKAFELIESRKNRIVSKISVSIAIYVGLMAIGFNCIELLKKLFNDQIIPAIIWTMVILIVIGYYITKYIQKNDDSFK